MPQQPIKKQILEMQCKGMGLGNRPDLLEEGKFIFLQNTRVFANGIIRSRPTIATAAVLSAATTNVIHSLKTIIDQSIANFARFAGAGTKLYSGLGTGAPLTEAASGFTGNPLSMVDFRPVESISPYVYIADKNKMIKVSSAGVASPFGLDAPKTSPTVAIDKPARKSIDILDAGSIANWTTVTGSAVAGVVSNRVNTTIAAILLDDAAVPCFCSIVPTAFPVSLQEGLILSLTGTNNEDVYVEKVEKAVIATGVATVSKIIYDAGVTGLCTISTSIAINDLNVDSILKLNASEYVRVSEIIDSTNNQTTFRCKTVGTIAAGNSIEGYASFRTFITTAKTVGDIVFADAMKSVVGASGLSSVGRIFNSDLTNTATRGLSLDDLFHISLRASEPSLITEIQIQLDINDGTFTKDYLYKAINPNFLTASASQVTPTIAVQQQVTQRNEVQNTFENFRRELFQNVLDKNPDSGMDFDNPVFWDGGVSPFTEIPSQLELGQLQWSELVFKLSEFLRFGSAESLGLKDVKAVRITVNSSAAVDIYVDSIWVGGGFGLDAITTDGKINPYIWVYCYEEAATRQKSSWSPPNRNGLFLSRGRAKLLAQVSSELSATDRIIWARFGGDNNDFRIVGVQPNDGSYFYDEFTDSLIAQNAQAGEPFTLWENRKPFTVLDKQRSGTCNVIGNKVVGLTGDTFNVKWGRGSEIIIDNIPTALFTSPTDTTHLEIEKDIGAKTNVKWSMPEPRIVGQPLPVMFGTFGQGEIGLIIFGLGDDNAAGTIYWLNGNEPHLQNENNYLEITAPSEPLMNGVIYDGIPFVWTTERSYMLIPSFIDGELQFSARENANSKGLFARWGICVGKDFIYYITTNGIERVQGVGNPESITDRDLQTLFPHAGYSVLTDTFVLPDGTIIYPPDFTKPNEMWLFYANNQVWFRFIDTQNKQRYLIYDEIVKGWVSYDKYEGDYAGAVYAEEGLSNFQTLIGLSGTVYVFADTGIVETSATKSMAYPPYLNQGDERYNKHFLEAALDVNSRVSSTSLLFTHLFDGGNSQTDVATSLPITNTRRIKVLDILTGQGKQAKNVSTFLKWNTVDIVSIYNLHYSFIEKVETTIERLSQFYDAGQVGDKLFRSLFLEADTFGANKKIYLYDDYGNKKAGPIIINHNGQIGKSYSFTPFIASKIKVSTFDYASGSRDTLDWDFYDIQFEVDKVPELDSATSQWFNDEDNTLKYLQGFILTADTDGADIEFDVQGDNEVVLGTFSVNSLNVSTIPFDFPTPVLTHQMRIVPKGNLRIYNVKWKFDKEPELARIWETQETTFGLTGLIQLDRSLIIGINSTAVVNLDLTIDGRVETYQFNSTGGLHKKLVITLKAAKGRLYKWRFYSTAKHRLYKQECEVRVKSCNDPNDFQVKNPFGDVSNQVGAEI
jgi:hypothetical protein